ncbi:glucosylglycerol hydrolase [Natronosalvus amylolyticus]|uniref:glucosylglycerol hydrolase n=1 Tax=Natronosalvus amylolyticus TaxID=2961994 RepID=UPI0020C9A1D4|nr:glucosylglycerol hydrolase [Natronosalvus amylolyticus]
MDTPHSTCTLLEETTDERCETYIHTLETHDDPFDAATELAPALGAHWHGDHAEFGFWTPELLDRGVAAEDVYLELLTPTESVDLTADETEATFRRELVSTRRAGAYTWAVVTGAQPGTRDRLGTLYRLTYPTENGWETIGDPLAYSLPFGAYAPAELYDVDRLHAERDDREYFETLGTCEEAVGTTIDDGLPRVDPATNVLELHPGTASAAGSLAGLTSQFESLGRTLEADDTLTPTEQTLAGYDSVQLMPIAPITESDHQPAHFELDGDDELPAPDGPEAAARTDTVTLRRPSMRNWGYDIVVYGFGAVNSAILETGRPDELVDFIATLHTLPQPMKVVFDIALGHADEGALELLNDYYIQGPGMYGQELDYTEPTVRAILLELQRRKMNWGADGIRVDGAQDFTNWDPETESEWHDDDFLAEMDAITQEIAGTEYRPWMIFEDGRPWPDEDWELASTYRTLIEEHPHSFQWGPVTFAHNTPAILTFWATKWWRVRELADMGGQWISGAANHDTLRRGAQVEVGEEWNATQENPALGDTLHETIEHAYNNPASNALFYCLLPGVPMDFLNASTRAPWDFIRDTDDTWNVKVVGEAAYFIDWRVPSERYDDPEHFTRLKALGIDDRDDLHEFVHALASASEVTDYDLETMATILSALNPPFFDGEPTTADLEEFALAWMRDVADYCTLSNWRDDLDGDQTAFDLELRQFRHERPWLRHDLRGDERFEYRHPVDGSVIYAGLRRAPDGSEDVLFVANMEGQSATVTPTDLVETTRGGWRCTIASPGHENAVAERPLTLEDSEVVVFTRTR